ncbi:MAG TPA: DUF4325 domain-containing protein [Desulfomonilaceae bacterium]|nr:DUF4325 domain-containing protein [Desulfomonilaceae bacterium]
MVGMRKRGDKVRQFILENVEQHSEDIVTFVSSALGISRQAVNKHIQHLIAQEIIVAQGATRDRRYTLRELGGKIFKYFLQNLQEDVVWRNDIAPMLSELPANARELWQYGATEMLTNAVDHSSGSRLIVDVSKTAITCRIVIIDDGEGIFKKIQRELALDDERHAVLELVKGKLTTDPIHHTGEGIFFSSKMFDHFWISSGNTFFRCGYRTPFEFVHELPNSEPGTKVFMSLRNNTTRTTKEIFDSFSDEDYGFTKTVVPVQLAQYGHEKLISRSQAKRLLARFDRFKTVFLDFENVESIGQAFADEIFRVFAREHPNVMIMETNTGPTVRQMIDRARHHD